MIKRIVLENWKAHSHSNFEFDKGTNVLIGPMGSGKTSIMDGICFALFGDFPALNAKRVSLDEVIMSKPNQMDKAKIELEFFYNGKNYTVERTIYRKGTNEGKLKEEGRLIAGPKVNEVTERIERLLEVNYDLFARAVYSEQNQIDFFLRLSPKQRREKFDELLDINKYEVARGNAVSLTNRIKKHAEDKKKWLSEQKERVSEARIKDARKKLGDKKVEKEGIEKELVKKNELIGSKKGIVEELEKKEKVYLEAKDLLLRLKAKEAENQSQLDKAVKELGNRDKAKVENEKMQLEKRIVEKEALVAKADEEIENFTKEQNELSIGINVNSNRVAQLDKHSSDLKKVGANCPVCRKALDEKSKDELLKENENEKKELEGKNKAMDEKRNEIGKKVEEAKKRKLAMKSEIEVSKKEANRLELIGKIVEAIDEYRKKIDYLKEEIVKTDGKLRELNFDDRLLRKEREELVKAKAEVDSLKLQIRANEDLVREIAANITREEELLKQMSVLESEVGRMENIANSLNVFVNALKATQAELREELINTVNEAMDDIWQRVYPYGDYTSAKIEIVNGEYEIVVRDRSGKWNRVEGILSGGERMSVAITIRIALSLVLTQNLSWLILDEPTHNLDRNAIASLAKIMKEHLPELVEQIFIITHERLMEEAATSKLYVLDRDKAADSPTRAEIKIVEEM